MDTVPPDRARPKAIRPVITGECRCRGKHEDDCIVGVLEAQ